MGGKRQNRNQGNKDFRENQKLTFSEVENHCIDFLSITTSDQLCDLLKLSYDELLSIYFPIYSQFEIRKKGKQRLIQSPVNILAEVQRKLAFYFNCVYLTLLNGKEINDVYSYIPAIKDKDFSSEIKNIVSNAKNHCNKKLVANIDLQNFFNSIKKERIENILMSNPFYFNDEITSFIIMIVLNDNCLPVGAPTSPILSNFTMLGIDEKFKMLPNVTYSRFADDLTFSTDNYTLQEFDTFLTQIIATIKDEGFSINYEKKKIIKSTSKQVVTGIVVNHFPNVERNYIRNIRAILHSIEKKGIDEAASIYGGKNEVKLINATQKYFEKQNIILPKIIILKHIDFHKNWFFIKSIRAKIEHIGYVKGKEDKTYKNYKELFLNLFKENSNEISIPQIQKSHEIVYVTNATANSIVYYAYCFLKNCGLRDSEIDELRKKFLIKSSSTISFDEILKSFQNQSAYFINLYSYMTEYNRFENFITKLEEQDKFKTLFKFQEDSQTFKKHFNRKFYHTNNECENLRSDYNENNKFFKNTGVFFDKAKVEKETFYVLEKSFLDALKMKECSKC